jgi:hypothetical protein
MSQKCHIRTHAPLQRTSSPPSHQCKVGSASTFDSNAGLNATIKRCADDEQKEKDQLQTQWSQFAPSDTKNN